MEPLITILLTTYNRVHLIGETLDSIIAQTYTNWECIIVDDHSTDNTEAYLQEYYLSKDDRFRYYKKDLTKYKKGLGGSRNQSLDIAKKKNAEYIQFFDDDDLMHCEKLNYQIEPFFYDSNIDFTLCEYEHLNLENLDLITLRSSGLPLKSENLVYDFITKNKLKINLNSCGPLWKASVWESHRFNEDLKTAEEYVAYCTLFIKKQKINYKSIPFLLFFYRKHKVSNTKSRYHEYEIMYSLNQSDKLVFSCLVNKQKLNSNLLKYYISKYIIINIDYSWYKEITKLHNEKKIHIPLKIKFLMHTFFIFKKIIIKLL